MSATRGGWPTRIGEFDVLAHIGTGRTSDVFSVIGRDGEKVALKWLHASLDPRRVARELHVAQRIRHPRIASFRAFGVDGGRTWVTMDLVEGTPLSTALGAIRDGIGAPSARFAAIAGLVADLADALSALHDAGLVHRALTPDCAVVDREGRAVLIDLGVAKRVDALLDPASEEVSITQELETDDRLNYLAPEQVRGEDATPQSDLHALGAILYEGLTGVVPSCARDGAPPADPLALAHAILHEAPVPAIERDPRVPVALSELASALLAKDTRDRPAFAGEVARRLRGEEGAPPASARTRLAPPTLEERATELGIVRDLLTEVASDSFRIVLVEGGLGVGKTRFLGEVARRAQRRGFVVGAVSTRGEPLVDALVRELAGTLEEHGGPEALSSAFGGSAAAARERLDEDPAPTSADPVSAGSPQRRLEVALRTLLQQAAGIAPVLIAIDDANLADDDAARALSALADLEAGTRVALCLALGDREPSAELSRVLARLRAKKTTARVSLGPLSSAGVAAAVGAMLGVRTPPPALLAHVARAGGNPFVVHELVQAAYAAGALRVDEDGWSFDKGKAAEIPATVHAVAVSRLAELSADERTLAAEAAIVGVTVRHDVLAFSTTLEGRAFHETLSALLRKRVLADHPAPRPTYAFAHAALRDTLLADLSDARKIALHRRVAESLVRVTRERPSFEALSWIAEHWEAAGAREQASRAYLWLVDRAMRRGDAASVSRALAGLDRTASPELAKSESARGLRVDAARMRGDFAEAERLLRAAAADEAPERRARAYVKLASVLQDEGRSRDALDAALEAVRALGVAKVPRGVLATLFNVVSLVVALVQKPPVLARGAKGDLACEAYLVASRAAYVIDRPMGVAAFFRARARARVLRLADYWGYIESGFCLALIGLGAFSRALPRIVRMREEYATITDVRLRAQAAVPLIAAHALAGRELAAPKFLEKALALAHSVGDKNFESLVLLYQAYLALQEGRLGDARAITERQLGDRTADHDVPFVGGHQLVLAHVAIAQGDPAAIAREARNAERLAGGRAAVAPHDEILCAIAATALSLALDDPGTAVMWGKRAALGAKAAKSATALSIEAWAFYLVARALDGIRTVDALDREAIAECRATLRKFRAARPLIARALALFAHATDSRDEAIRALEDAAEEADPQWGSVDFAVNELLLAKWSGDRAREDHGRAVLEGASATAPRWLARIEVAT